MTPGNEAFSRVLIDAQLADQGLHNDRLWASEYETFVLQVSFAGPGETITFAEAFAAARRLMDRVYREEKVRPHIPACV